LVAALIPRPAEAQNITVDGRFSPAQTLIGPNYSITANLGKQVGGNLFHSFGQFGLSTGESAAFSGPASVSNVIGRVTGGNPSAIDGRIQSNIAGANLYLINPSGIVFGPNATVNVSGSFHVSTADYIRMSDGAKFQATNPNASTLSAAPPAAFGFLTPRPASIAVNGSNLGPVPGTLSLVGGPVSINSAATLAAPGGTIHLASAAGTGEVPVDPHNTAALTVSNFGPVDIRGGSTLDVGNPNRAGPGGSVFVHAGALTVDASDIGADNYGSGPGGVIALRGETQVALSNGAVVHAAALGDGSGASIAVSAAPSGVVSVDASTVETRSSGAGSAGLLSIVGGQLTITNGGNLTSLAEGRGSGGQIMITAGSVVSDGGASFDQTTGVFSTTSGTGGGGPITIAAGQLELRNGAVVIAQSSDAGVGGALGVSVNGPLKVESGSFLGTFSSAGSSAGGVSVVADGPVTIDMSAIGSQTTGAGNAGDVTVIAPTLTIANYGVVLSNTVGAGNISAGNSGNIFIDVAGTLSIAGPNGPKQSRTGILADALPDSSGNAGKVTVSAGNLSILNNGEISSGTFGSGNAGSIAISVAGRSEIDGTGADAGTVTGISAQAYPESTGKAGDVSVSARDASIVKNGVITSATFGPGDGGSVVVDVANGLLIDGTGANPVSVTGIVSEAVDPQSAANVGNVSVRAGTLSLVNGGVISSTTFGRGNGGNVAVDVAGALSIDGRLAASFTGIASQADRTSIGNAGGIAVNAGSLSIADNGAISSTTFGPGNGGSITIGVAGALSISASGENPLSLTGVASQANPGSTGNAGNISLHAGSLSIGGGTISSITSGPGNGGDIAVTAGDTVALARGGAGVSGITASASPGSTGHAGAVMLSAGGSVVLSGGAVVASSTGGAGDGGTVRVTAQGPLALSDPRTGIFASATSSASGNAGSVRVLAPQISIATGSEIASATAGSGAGGSVVVTALGPLFLHGNGDPNTQIAASATGPQSGRGGSVTIAADSLTVDGGAQISAATAGPGIGGDVIINAASDIALAGRGPQITARSTGGGDAGSITISAVRLLMNNGGAISTEAETSTASGGNITLKTRDFLYLLNSEITTSVKGETGNGGNILIDPQLVVLNHSRIIADAVQGHGGNITINAGEFIPSSDSVISATSQLGISGTIEITGPRVDVNGALVVLSSELRGRAAVLREACAARADRPISTLVDAGRGGLPQDPEATLPALYIAGRDLDLSPHLAADSAGNALQTAARLTMRCS
jgi:filamentous hemagglutinin family protein